MVIGLTTITSIGGSSAASFLSSGCELRVERVWGDTGDGGDVVVQDREEMGGMAVFLGGM